jgi:LysM repeat protein
MIMKRLIALVLILIVVAPVSAKVIGRVNGFPITEREANDFLKVVTKGKLKYDQIRPNDKEDVVKHIATDSLLIGLANRELSRKERNQVMVNYWLSKKIRKINVTDAEAQKAYKGNKSFFKGHDGKVLPYAKVKEAIFVSLKQKKYIDQLMSRAKITLGKKVIKSPKKGSAKKTKASKTSAGQTKTYEVQSGNTLSGIAHKYHITVKQLRSLNGMSEKDVLKIGQKLKVPTN